MSAIITKYRYLALRVNDCVRQLMDAIFYNKWLQGLSSTIVECYISFQVSSKDLFVSTHKDNNMLYN